MPIEMPTIKTLLKDAMNRLSREEGRDDPDMRSIMFTLSSLTTAALGIAASIEEMFGKLLDVEKSHDARLLELSRRIIKLSAGVSIAGALIVIIGKFLLGMVFK